MSETNRDSSAGRYSLFLLLGAVLGWVAAWNLTGAAGEAPPRAIRLVVASAAAGQPVPAWVAAFLESTTAHEQAVDSLRPLYPALEYATNPQDLSLRFRGFKPGKLMKV